MRRSGFRRVGSTAGLARLCQATPRRVRSSDTQHIRDPTLPVPAHLALPDHRDRPAKSPEAASISTVTPHAVRAFRLPKLRVRHRTNLPSPACMHVPEAAVNEYHSPMLREDYIGGARKIPAVESEAVAHSVKRRSHSLLWRRVLPTNAGHVPASASLGDSIRHDDRASGLLGEQTGVPQKLKHDPSNLRRQ